MSPEEFNAVLSDGLEGTSEMASEISVISDRMKKFRWIHCGAETIYSALQAMKENPTISIPRAFEIGCEEWDV